MKPITSIVHKS